MSAFPDTRAAAGYITRHARGELAGRVKGSEQAMDDDTLAVQVRHQPGYSIVTVAGTSTSSPRRGSASGWPRWRARAGQ